MKTFNNKVAFITGGASGIGLGMAKAFAEKGAHLALADISASELESVKTEFAEAGHDILTFALDVSDREALRHAANQVVEHFGAVHIVCANAGVSGHMGPLEEGSDADWDWVIDVNLKGAINTIQAFLPHILANDNEGHFVITSSVSGLRVHRPSRGQGMYNTTKFALMGFGEALSLDMEPHGVGVSILCPGIVNTQISNSGRNRPDRFGGTVSVNEGHELAKAALSGTDPLEYGRWVSKAIEQNRLYVLTHEYEREQIGARHKRIEEAFDHIEELKV